MVKFVLYVIAIAAIFGAGYVTGCTQTDKKSRVNSYLKSMRYHGN
jgi:outer membrane murein-binding lipoprotein Lpp